MLSITVKKGQTSKDVGAVADYPDENRNKEKQVGAVEDYYAQGSDKTPSRWMGGAAESLGLSGIVDREDHKKTLQGLDPKTGQGLVQGAGENRRYAWDLTFSAPKSVSIAWAIGGEKTRAEVEAAQMRSVEKVLGFIEQNFPLARRGSSEKGTITHEKAKLLAASFLHGSSREQDPQIHTHLMLQNLVLREDGSFGTIDAKQLYEWKMAMGAVYRAELAKEMSAMGFSIEADADSFRINGIPKELEEEFSRRRGQIEAKLAEKGLTGGKASEVAALDTREKKEIIDTNILRKDWDARAAVHGVTRETVEELKSLEKEATWEIDRTEILQKLTRMESVFEEKDLFKAVGIARSHEGRGSEEVEREVAALKHHHDIVKLRGQNGKIYYTTKEMLELEKGILFRARAGKDDRSHILDEKTVQNAISRFEKEKGFPLSDEQKSSIIHMTQKEGRTKIVQGHAGAGKSTALVPVRYAYEESGFEVVGCALQGKTAKLMEKETGIKSQTIASLLRELEGYDRDDGTRADPTRKLSAKSVIVVDEAMMCDTRTLDRLQSLTDKSGAKLELVGDVAQVPPVAAGNPVKSLMKEIGFAELTENRRQKADWQKQASREIREGNVKAAFERYANAGMITVVKTRDEALKTAVDKWSKTYDPARPNETPLTAYRNNDVAELNRLAREFAKGRGLLAGPECIATTWKGDLIVQEGDRIMFRKKDKKIGIVNGETGTIEKIDLSNGNMHVRVDGGKTVVVPATYDRLEYGYALTINKSQGLSEKSSVGLVSLQNLEQTYVQSTRHKEAFQMVMIEDQVDLDMMGLDSLPPTEKMMKYAKDLAKKSDLAIPEGLSQDFDLCREFLNAHASKKLEERESFDFGLERVESLINSLSRSREKMNALDFEIEEEKEVTSPEKEQREIEEEVHESSSPEIGKEEGIRIPERAIERERVLELEL